MGRDVLIAPIAVSGIDDHDASMGINLQKAQIERAPPIDHIKPISRQYEEAYYGHFRWVPYWEPDTMTLGTPIPHPGPTTGGDGALPAESKEQSHLRSSADVTGYGIHARDGDIGHIEDLVVDDEDWIIRYAEVDTTNWLPGKKVLVQTGRIERIDWLTRSVTMLVTRDAIQSAPVYDPAQLITPDYEIQLFRHYGKDGVR